MMMKQITKNLSKYYQLSIVKPKILVVENDTALIEILEELFKENNWDFRIMKDVMDIKSTVKEFKPDLVILDYLLPLVNGGELCSQIKQDPQTKNIPVLLYSAYSKVLLSIGDYGCDVFIPKPFELDMLLEQINKLLKKREKVKENKPFLSSMFTSLNKIAN
jgi:DNA-binding response OmpR family regulator